MFNIVFIIITISFILVFANILRRIMIWNKNNHSPQLYVFAEIVSKRIDVIYHRHTDRNMTGNYGHHTTSNTLHYVTFQFENGDRKEFFVKGPEYGLLKEGDKGNLCFQGTRYLSFERNK